MEPMFPMFAANHPPVMFVRVPGPMGLKIARAIANPPKPAAAKAAPMPPIIPNAAMAAAADM